MLLVEKDIAQSLMGEENGYMKASMMIKNMLGRSHHHHSPLLPFSQYHKNRKDEKESDFQWENFPGLLQEFKQGQFYTGTINSKGRKTFKNIVVPL